MTESLRIGELAAASGVTVRTLHYYDQIGLLAVPQRTASGHRIYGDEEVERLYRISLLRQLGLRLEEIRNALDDATWDLRASLVVHTREVERRLEGERRLRRRLTSVLATLDDGGTDLKDGLLGLLEDMTMEKNVQARITTLVYADPESARDYLERVFQLGPGRVDRDAEGRVVHAEVEAGDGVVWLHPESADYHLQSPRTAGASTAMVAVMVDDVDAHYEHARSHGAEIVYDPVDQPYGYREYSARDPEGHLWSFMKASS